MCKPISKSEIVGSFLRPEELLVARAKFETGTISMDELKNVEDEAITKLIEKQKEVEVAYYSDGEFRRSYWHLDFFWGLGNVEHLEHDRGYQFHGKETRKDSASLIGKLEFNPTHPVFEEFNFLATLVDKEKIRISIPSPSQFLAELLRGVNAKKVDEFYNTHEDLHADIAKVYNQTIVALYDLGLRHLKLDDCTWGMLVDESFWTTMTGGEFDTDKLQELYLSVNNAALEGLQEDLVISTHVCRGNYHSTWATKGGYEPVAPNLFGKENVTAFFLEFDDERSGGFEPLRHVPEGKYVVLGLVTSKNGELEDEESIIARIKEASKYVPLERLSLSPQCGFASTEEGNILTDEDQWKKLKLINDISKKVWPA